MSALITTIRKAAVAALKAAPLVVGGVTIPADKIFDSPSYDLDDIEDVPAMAVYLTSVKADRSSLTSQTYDKTYQLVVEVVLEAATDVVLADLKSEAEEEINKCLLVNRAWSLGARSVEQDGAEFRKSVPSRTRCAGVNISYLISINTAYAATLTGGSSAVVHDSPKPKTTAGWASQEA